MQTSRKMFSMKKKLEHRMFATRRFSSASQDSERLIRFLSIFTHGQQRPTPLPHSLTTFHKKINRADDVSYFEKYSQLKPEPTVEDLHLAIQRNSPKDAWTIYKLLHMNNMLHKIDIEMHTSLLAQTSIFPLFHDAAVKGDKILENMRALELLLDARDYLYLMTIHYRNKNDVGRIVELFEQAKTIDGMVPSIQMYSILLLSLAKAQLLDQCLKYYIEMCKSNPYAHLNAQALATLIDAFGYSFQLDGAKKIFNQYLEQVESSKIPRKLDISVFESKIRALAFNNSLDEALFMFDGIEKGKYPVKLELSTYDAILEAISYYGTFEEAKKYWAKMNAWCIQETLENRTNFTKYELESIFKSPIITPDHYHFSFLGKGQGENYSEKVVYPFMTTFESLLTCASKNLDLNTIFQVFYACQRGYSIPSFGMYELMIHALEQGGREELSAEWRDGIRKRGYYIPSTQHTDPGEFANQ